MDPTRDLRVAQARASVRRRRKMYDPETKTYVLLLEQGSMMIEEKQEGKGVDIYGHGIEYISLDRADIRDLISCKTSSKEQK